MHIKNYNPFYVILFLSFFVLSSGVEAQVYKCKDANGQLSYSDKPCVGEKLSSLGNSTNLSQAKSISAILRKKGFTSTSINSLSAPTNNIMTIFLSGERAKEAKAFPIAANVSKDYIPSVTSRKEFGRLAGENQNIVIIYEKGKAHLAAAYPINCKGNSACPKWRLPKSETAKWCAVTLFVGEDFYSQGLAEWQEDLNCDNDAVGIQTSLEPTKGIPNARAQNPTAIKNSSDMPAGTPAQMAPLDYYPGK